MGKIFVGSPSLCLTKEIGRERKTERRRKRESKKDSEREKKRERGATWNKQQARVQQQ